MSGADGPTRSGEVEPGRFIVRFSRRDGVPVGVGLLVGETQILTCAHVVNAALGLDPRSQAEPAEPVAVEFPLLPEPAGPRQARVVEWVPPPQERSAGDDIAGLELVDGPAPDGAHPAKLVVNLPAAGHPVRVFGYPGTPPRPSGAWVSTSLRGRVEGNRLQLDSGPDAALRVQPGFSGSPVYDDTTGRVIGIIAFAPPARVGDRDSYATTADRLRLAWPKLLDRHSVGRRATDRRRQPGRAPDGAAQLTVLHVSDPQFGKHHLFGGNGLTPADQAYDTLHARLHRDLTGLADEHGLRPDLMVVTGDLAEWGLRSEFEQVSTFLAALAEAAELPRNRIAIVPGNHDVNRKTCQAYFTAEEGDEREPVPPYFPKWKQFVAMFDSFYAGLSGATFTPDEPWTLFEMPELGVVVAGLNSTMAESHRDTDHYGLLGERQLDWFADRLAHYRDQGWLRIGAVHHNVVRGAVADDENLRDADDLDRILGEPGLLNLLLHGHTHDGRLHRLPSGLVTLATGSAAVKPDARPAEVPNQYQLVTIRRDGFTRHARQYAPGQKRWIGDTRISRTGSDWRDHHRHDFTDAEAVFPVQLAAGSADYAGPQRHRGRSDRSASERLTNPFTRTARTRLDDHVDDAVHSYETMRVGAPGGPESFLSLVLEATRVRFPEATVTSRPEEGYLRISNPLPGGVGVEQWAVGVIDGDPTEEGITRFAAEVHARFAAADPGIRSELVHSGSPADASLIAAAKRRGIVLRSLVEYQGLIDLRPLLERQAKRLAEDRIYPAELYLPQRYRLIDGPHEGEIHDNLHEKVIDWLSAESARFVMVLGDFGRGKTALLRHLTRELPGAFAHVQPILVELRRLEKGPTLIQLLTQHLVQEQVEFTPAKLDYMIRSGRVALLFDGFDELELRVGYDNAADYLRTLLESVTDRTRVVLTSRTQHFRSAAQVRTALGDRVAALAASRVVELADFSHDQIREFLGKLYEGDVGKAEARFRLLGEIEDLLGLARNPRMLGFIAALDEKRLRAVQRQEGRISAAELYRELVDFWLVGEADRQRHRRGLPSFDDQERLDACTALALRLWASTEPAIPLAELSAEVADTLDGLAERGYNPDQAAHAIASGTLLVRTDEDSFTFVHQSIMEWLVADAAAHDLAADADSELLASRRLSRLMADFLCDLAGHEPSAAWAARTLADPSARELAKQNALLVQERIGVAVGRTPTAATPRQSLAGVDLRSQDLVGQDLRGANLRGANLRGMRLEGVDLADSDLREADFTGARLVGGSLRGARLDGSQWDRAALLGTEVPNDMAGLPELQGLAIPGLDGARAIVAPGGTVNCVTFSPDGAVLAAGRGSVVELIDRTEGRIATVLSGHAGQVNDLAFSPDGTHIATASDDSTTRIWNLATGKVRTILSGHTDWVTALTYSPDGTRIATRSRDNTVKIWNTTTGRVLRTISERTSQVTDVAWSPDGTEIATATALNTTRIWDSTTGRNRKNLKGRTASLGPISRVTAVTYSPDGTRIATASDDSTTTIWGTDTDQALTVLIGHAGPVVALAYSPDGTHIATASSDTTTRIWNVTTGKTRTTLTGHTDPVVALAYSPDGTHIATTSRDDTIRIWNTTTGKTLTTLTGNTNWVTAATYSPDGTHIATTSRDNTAKIWDLATGKVRTTLTGHTDWVTAATYSPDGTHIATTSRDGTTKIWNTATGRLHKTLTGHKNSVWALGYSPDGTHIATASSDDTAKIWNTTTGRTVTTLTGHTDAVVTLAYSPDGTHIATASRDNTARIWNATTGRLHKTLPGHADWVTALTYSPDGTHIATTSRDNTARIWNTTTGRLHKTLTGHTDWLTALTYSPDGTHIATTSVDNTTRIWDPDSGKLLATLVALPDDGYAVLLPDGGYKIKGEAGDVLWWAVKLCRFGPGELDPYVPGLRRLPDDHPII